MWSEAIFLILCKELVRMIYPCVFFNLPIFQTQLSAWKNQGATVYKCSKMNCELHSPSKVMYLKVANEFIDTF